MNKYLRQNLQNFQNYHVEKVEENYIANANENPFNFLEKYKEQFAESLLEDINRYPDPLATKVRSLLADYVNARPEEILVGSGGDECIKIVMESYLSKGDKILIHEPSFSMYRMNAKIQEADILEVPDLENFQIDIDGMIKLAKKEKVKLILLCLPNNPTGFGCSREQVEKLIRESQSLIVIDGAYMEFSSEDMTDLYSDRVIVLRTLSKAFGLAGIRTGYLVSSEKNIQDMLKVKPPYNVSRPSQRIAEFALSHREEVLASVEEIKDMREDMYFKLNKIQGLKAFPSQGNFILVKVQDKESIRARLKEESLKIKDYSSGILSQYFRISISTKEVNEKILRAFGDKNEKK